MGRMTEAAMLEAIDAAMEAEKDAAQFYRSASKHTGNDRGKQMLESLAKFEDAHFRILDTLKKSMTQGGVFEGYNGTTLEEKRPEAPAKAMDKQSLETDMDALKVAIASERSAQRHYEEMAEGATAPEIAALFRKLAEEESLHEKVLNDQFLALSNEGFWTWGE